MQQNSTRTLERQSPLPYTKERRASRRQVNLCQCKIYDASGRCIDGITQNISDRGLYVTFSTNTSFKSGNINTPVSLELEYGGTSQCVDCEITRNTDEGVVLNYSIRNSTATFEQFQKWLLGSNLLYDTTSHTKSETIKIELDSVARRWGANLAIDNFSSTFHSGEIIALVGPSGGGKSTLLRMIAGVTRPSAGKVIVNSRNLNHMSMRALRLHRANCGIIQQNHLLVPQLSVHQNVISGMLAKWPLVKIAYSSFWPVEKHRVAQLLRTLGIEEYQWQLASTLSGGQQQRVAIARAIANKPRIILADEPTSSLDPSTANDATQLIIDFAKRENALLIFCTHQLNNVKHFCSRIIGVRQGKCLFDTRASDLTDTMMDSLYAGSRERY